MPIPNHPFTLREFFEANGVPGDEAMRNRRLVLKTVDQLRELGYEKKAMRYPSGSPPRDLYIKHDIPPELELPPDAFDQG